jgi:hypothetical protein
MAEVSDRGSRSHADLFKESHRLAGLLRLPVAWCDSRLVVGAGDRLDEQLPAH